MRKTLINRLPVCCLLAITTQALAIDTRDTRLLSSQPAVSAGNTAFVYAEGLWVAHIDGNTDVYIQNPQPDQVRPPFPVKIKN